MFRSGSEVCITEIIKDDLCPTVLAYFNNVPNTTHPMASLMDEWNVERHRRYALNKDVENARKRSRYQLQKRTCAVESSTPTHLRGVIRPVPAGTCQVSNMYLRLSLVPTKAWTLPPVPVCTHCSAVRFFRETPAFCCSNGQVSLEPYMTSESLTALFMRRSDMSTDFMRYVRTYNNALAFTSLGVKYDKTLCSNDKNIYTFRVQGMVHHFINNLTPVDACSTNLQIYFYETTHQLPARLSVSDQLRPDIVSILIDILNCNPYVKFFRYLRDVPCLEEFKVFLRCDPSLDQRTYNLPTIEQVVAIWKDSDTSSTPCERHIQVFTHAGTPQLVNYYYGCYDPLQYPLLLPYGQPGWHVGIPKVFIRGNRPSGVAHFATSFPNSAVDLLQSEAEGSYRFPTYADSLHLSCFSFHLIIFSVPTFASTKRRSECVSVRQYYCYRLQMRASDDSILLCGGRLLQQWVTDQYIKVESQRLDYFRHEQKQKHYRTETLQGIVDSVDMDGITDASKIGQ